MSGIRVDTADVLGYVQFLPFGVVLTVQCLAACLDSAPLFLNSWTEGEVYSWGKGARGRLGRRDEDAGLPKPVQLDETHPYVVTSVSCCHGNTLLAVRCESRPISPPLCVTLEGGINPALLHSLLHPQ